MSNLVDSWEVVERFERRMAAYCGAPHAVAVDTCTAAIFLCIKRRNPKKVAIPCRTYLGVACAVLNAGCALGLDDEHWWGGYALVDEDDDPICADCACRLWKDCAKNVGCPMCLSFQYRKHLKIGRGGMILTASAEDAAWFRKARFCGRAEPNGVPEFVGWHCFMEPERAARGLVLMDSLPDRNEDLVFEYPDLRDYEVLR